MSEDELLALLRSRLRLETHIYVSRDSIQTETRLLWRADDGTETEICRDEDEDSVPEPER